MTKEEIFSAILQERERQDSKWGPQNHDTHAKYLAILAEEFGEVAECVCKTEVPPINLDEKATYEKEMVKELIQVAAVVFKWLEHRG